MWVVVLATLVVATDVKFTPGPGLKRNEDGTYSRSLNREYLESVGAVDEEETGSPGRNVAVTLVLLIAAVAYANREALVASARDPDATRAARLARFTGDGPTKADVTMQDALKRNPTEAPKPRPIAKPRIATLSSVKSDDNPDEFFGGDSTNTQW